MAVVSEIREIKGMVELSLDGVRWLKLRKKHFSMHQLVEDTVIDPGEYIDSIAAVQAADCYEAALTILDQAAQTRSDIIKKLCMKGYVRPAAEAAAARLCEIGLIDDRRYAERIAQGQLKKPVGVYAVRRKLMAKQFSEEDVEAAMEGFDEEQQADACRIAAEKLWRKYSALPSREGRAKLSQALARRGFSWDAIRNTVDAIASDEEFYE